MLLKDIYSTKFFNEFLSVIKEVVPGINTSEFLKEIFSSSWEQMELKQRMKNVSFVLNSYLSNNYSKACQQIIAILTLFKQKGFNKYALEWMFFADYIETYGINHFKTSVEAIEQVTRFTSCEFAVRPFIIEYETEMMQVMLNWSLHENEHVRRLSTEGCRPRLPWAMALPKFKNNPTLILPILENLKKDSSEYVRRSVANNLNDITKDNPQIVISIAKKWKGKNKETDALIKHGVRTLLKQGNKEILNLYHLKNSRELECKEFNILTNKVLVNSNLSFSFLILNNGNKKENIRLEYAIYFLLNNGTLTKKIFKISEREILPNTRLNIEKKHNFKVISTRKFYAGEHKISIILNGVEKAKKEFFLVL